MNPLEYAAAALGVITVALVVRRSVWNYPFGIAMVSLYFFIFLETRLYSDALLQIFFVVVNLYGWRNWVQAKSASGGDIPVQMLDARERLLWLAGLVAASTVWGLIMDRTDAAAPVVDAFVAGFSIGAQILLARRYLENWVLWIAVDIVAIGLYWSRGLQLTSGLYFIFLLLAVTGLIEWLRSWRAQAAA